MKIFHSSCYNRLMEQKPKKAKYRVHDMITDLYLDDKQDKFTGEPTWSKKGKSWASVEDLQAYFKNLEARRITVSPLWEVIEIYDAKTEGDRYPANVLSLKKNGKI